MPTLQFEHPIKDYATWKAAFDRDPIDRPGLGVRRHVIYRPSEDQHYIIGELEFDTAAQAHACVGKLHELWNRDRRPRHSQASPRSESSKPSRHTNTDTPRTVRGTCPRQRQPPSRCHARAVSEPWLGRTRSARGTEGRAISSCVARSPRLASRCATAGSRS